MLIFVYSFLEGGFVAAMKFLMKEECPYSIGSSLVDVSADAFDTVFGAGASSSQLGTKRPPVRPSLTSGSLSAGSLMPSTVLPVVAQGGLDNFLFSNNKSSAADVIEVEAPKGSGSATGGLLSFMDRLKTSAAPVNSSKEHIASTPVMSNSNVDDVSVSPVVGIEEIKNKMSIFGSSTLASFRRVVSTSASNTPAVNDSPLNKLNRESIGDVDYPRSTTANDGIDSPIIKNTPKGAFVIDDEDEPDITEGSPNDGVESGGEQSTHSDTGSKIGPRIGGAKRNNSLIISNVSESNPQLARLQGGGIIDVDPVKIGVTRTEAEKAQALAMHKLAGVRKGDKITISRETLPGALLFPCRKIKKIRNAVVKAGDEEAIEPSYDKIESNGSKEVEEIDRGTYNYYLFLIFKLV